MRHGNEEECCNERGRAAARRSLSAASRRGHHGLAAHFACFLANGLTYSISIPAPRRARVNPRQLGSCHIKRWGRGGTSTLRSPLTDSCSSTVAQPGGSSWRNRFAVSPVSHVLRHVVSVGNSPPLQLISCRSRERACRGTASSTSRGLAFQACSSSSTPVRVGDAGWVCHRSYLRRTAHPAAPPETAA